MSDEPSRPRCTCGRPFSAVAVRNGDVHFCASCGRDLTSLVAAAVREDARNSRGFIPILGIGVLVIAAVVAVWGVASVSGLLGARLSDAESVWCDQNVGSVISTSRDLFLGMPSAVLALERLPRVELAQEDARTARDVLDGAGGGGELARLAKKVASGDLTAEEWDRYVVLSNDYADAVGSSGGANTRLREAYDQLWLTAPSFLPMDPDWDRLIDGDFALLLRDPILTALGEWKSTSEYARGCKAAYELR